MNKQSKKLNYFSLWLAYLIVGFGLACLLNFNPSHDQIWIVAAVAIGIALNFSLERLAQRNMKQKRKRG